MFCMGTQLVIPLRVYDDMEAAQRFLVEVFGVKRGRLIRDPNGRPFHAEVHTGDSVIWIHRVDLNTAWFQPGPCRPNLGVSLSSLTM
jgi:uncharacterized glyoxalase superfamily protein PhnB